MSECYLDTFGRPCPKPCNCTATAEEVCFILWYWTNGWRPKTGYDADKVNTVARMIRANYKLPHRIVCVTDAPEGITEAETVEMWSRPVINGKEWVARPNCFHRLRVFDSEFMLSLLGPAKYYWSMDLDVVILKDFTWLTPSCDYTAVQGRHAKYNGSMWAVRPGTNRHVWMDFHPEDSPRAIIAAKHAGRPIVGSDQAWMSMQIPNGDRWPVGEAEFCKQYMDHIHGPEFSENTGIVFFAGNGKPWQETVKLKCPRLYQEFERYAAAS